MIHAAVDGPSGSAVLQLALDTGATGTMINAGMLVALGYDPALAPERIQVTTGSGVEFVPRRGRGMSITPVSGLKMRGQAARRALPALVQPLCTG